MFKLYEGIQAKWSDAPLNEYEILGVNGSAETTFEALNVNHKYQCGVRVEVSRGIYTSKTTFESKFTKKPKGVKPCLQQICLQVLRLRTHPNNYYGKFVEITQR